MVHFAIANYTPNLKGWSDPPGRFYSALEATLLTAPYHIGIILSILGLVLWLIALYVQLILMRATPERIKK